MLHILLLPTYLPSLSLCHILSYSLKSLLLHKEGGYKEGTSRQFTTFANLDHCSLLDLMPQYLPLH